MEWQLSKLTGQGRRSATVEPLGTILAGDTFCCAYCNGTGIQVHMRSKCPVCQGKCFNQVHSPVVVCAFCHGSGESQLNSHITCTACGGKGVIAVKEPIEKCDACRGLGRVAGSSLPCLKCKGAGVFTAKKR